MQVLDKKQMEQVSGAGIFSALINAINGTTNKVDKATGSKPGTTKKAGTTAVVVGLLTGLIPPFF